MYAAAHEQFARECIAMEAQVREAFRGVTRVGGTSWSESVIVDGDGSGRTREQARALDTESSWEDLVDDPTWNNESWMGGFNFLDPIGFRYYMAPAMVLCLRNDGGEMLGYALCVDNDFKRELVRLLNARQAHVVASFVRLKIRISRAAGDYSSFEAWAYTYRKHWKAWDRGDSVAGG